MTLALVERVEERLSPLERLEGASADGFVDEVIAPSETRGRIASCFESLADLHRPPARASNIPL
jgi:acetyl-CoA carboxylase carboxyltransferase component